MNHVQSFKKEALRTSTSLAGLVQGLKESGKEYTIDWSVVRTAKPYGVGGRECDLCVSESYVILKEKDRVINRQNEIIIKCLHKSKGNFAYWRKMRNK